jgi:hypothetical protein
MNPTIPNEREREYLTLPYQMRERERVFNPTIPNERERDYLTLPYQMRERETI